MEEMDFKTMPRDQKIAMWFLIVAVFIGMFLG